MIDETKGNEETESESETYSNSAWAQEDQMQIMKKKAELLKERKISAHIVLKTGRFYNGIIKEVVFDGKTNNDKDFFIIEDRYLGEMLILFEELVNIDKHVDLKKKDERYED